MFWKSGKDSSLEELTNPMFVCYNQFYWELHCRCCCWNFPKSLKTIFKVASLGKFIDQLLLKVISLQEKNTGRLIFWRNKEKKMNNKHSQVLLVFRKNPRKWSFGWGSVLKTCTALIAGIFERICCFDKVFSMALTFTEQLFIEIPLYRRFLHNIHLSYSR